MRTLLLAATASLLLTTSPARATGGLLCETADGSELKISLGFGHVPGAPIVARHLWDKGRMILVAVPQWWLDDKEMRAVLTDAKSLETLATLRTKRKGLAYDGTVDWKGKSRWIRCRES